MSNDPACSVAAHPTTAGPLRVWDLNPCSAEPSSGALLAVPGDGSTTCRSVARQSKCGRPGEGKALPGSAWTPGPRRRRGLPIMAGSSHGRGAAKIHVGINTDLGASAAIIPGLSRWLSEDGTGCGPRSVRGAVRASADEQDVLLTGEPGRGGIAGTISHSEGQVSGRIRSHRWCATYSDRSTMHFKVTAQLAVTGTG